MATATANIPTSRLAKLLIAALVLVLAWQLAHWTWVFFAPRVLVSEGPAEGGADLALAARLFGGSASDRPTQGSASGLRLKGVVAPTPGTTAGAIFGIGTGRDVAVKLDGEVQPGVKLVEVLPESVVVSRGGVRERIDLEKRMSAASPTAPGARSASNFRLNVARSSNNNYSLSRKELDDALRDPNQLNYLGRIGVAPGGGVRMDAAPAGSLAQKLGLQPGDVIKKLNGQPVASTGDLARLYTQFGTLSMVEAEVQRGSLTVQLSYAIQP
ncbi:type II secretion system protein N [Usitatibacter palustris]|nr:type II secretion system protein N [Usitatibacter palustris]